MLDQLLVPTLPVSCELLLFVTAPLDENKTNPAAVPKVGACAKFIRGKDTKVRIEEKISNFFAIVSGLTAN